MHITFVKKILADGSTCRKCREVEARLLDTGYMDSIDAVVIADERDARSEGMLLARHYRVDRAPFFVARADDGTERVYTVYFKFLKEVLQSDAARRRTAGPQFEPQLECA